MKNRSPEDENSSNKKTTSQSTEEEEEPLSATVLILMYGCKSKRMIPNHCFLKSVVSKKAKSHRQVPRLTSDIYML